MNSGNAVATYFPRILQARGISVSQTVPQDSSQELEWSHRKNMKLKLNIVFGVLSLSLNTLPLPCELERFYDCEQ